ncbi:hypothetical protein M0802_015203 [Mischocyttarus mexicanus]|nr:hypothetical protein M0802_015203 [Mischocyttarus mexicanus]
MGCCPLCNVLLFWWAFHGELSLAKDCYNRGAVRYHSWSEGIHSAAVQDGVLTGHSSSTTLDCQSTTVGNLAFLELRVGSVWIRMGQSSISATERSLSLMESSRPSDQGVSIDYGRIIDKIRKFLDTVESDRKKSSSLKGSVSGSMKRCLADASKSLQLLDERHRSGRTDPSAEERANSLRGELVALEDRNAALQQEIARLKAAARKNEEKKQVKDDKMESSACYDRGVVAEKTKNKCAIVSSVDLPKRLVRVREAEPLSIAQLNEGFRQLTYIVSDLVGCLKARGETEVTVAPSTGSGSCGGKSIRAGNGGEEGFMTVTRRKDRKKENKEKLPEEEARRKQRAREKKRRKRKRRQEKRLAERQDALRKSGGPPPTLPLVVGRRVDQESVRGVGPVKAGAKVVMGRMRKEAAVAITCQGDMTYRDALVKLREKVDVSSLGLDGMKCRRGATGSYIYRIRGSQADEKAAKLVAAISTAVPGVRASCPRRFGELRIFGLDASASGTEIRDSLARLSEGTDFNLVEVGEVAAGRGNLGQVYVRAPETVLREAVKRGSLTLGWTRVRVVRLPSRLIRCFRCRARGHVAMRCPCLDEVGRSCFRCGVVGHRARDCRDKPCCLPCKKAGRGRTDHRAGSAVCPIVPPKKLGDQSAAIGTAVRKVRECDLVMEVDSREDLPTGTSGVANLNHARRAQDLLVHRMMEINAGVAVVAESWWIPPGSAEWCPALGGTPLAAVLVSARVGQYSLLRRRPSQQTSKLKKRIVKPLIVSPFSSASSEKDVRINENVAPSLDIRMDPDRIFMKAMKDITIVEEDRRRSANLKKEVSGSMKRHLASAAEAIALAREKSRVQFEDSGDSTIIALKFELQRMEERQKALEKRNRLLEREVDKLRKEGKNDSSKKKSGNCYKNALPQRGQEDAASRCKITEDIRIPKESVVAKRLEKLSKPPSNNEARIDSLVASVATLATAIAEIQRQVKSLVKHRDN